MSNSKTVSTSYDVRSLIQMMLHIELVNLRSDFVEHSNEQSTKVGKHWGSLRSIPWDLSNPSKSQGLGPPLICNFGTLLFLKNQEFCKSHQKSKIDQKVPPGPKSQEITILEKRTWNRSKSTKSPKSPKIDPKVPKWGGVPKGVQNSPRTKKVVSMCNVGLSNDPLWTV